MKLKRNKFDMSQED